MTRIVPPSTNLDLMEAANRLLVRAGASPHDKTEIAPEVCAVQKSSASLSAALLEAGVLEAELREDMERLGNTLTAMDMERRQQQKLVHG